MSRPGSLRAYPEIDECMNFVEVLRRRIKTSLPFATAAEMQNVVNLDGGRCESWNVEMHLYATGLFRGTVILLNVRTDRNVVNVSRIF